MEIFENQPKDQFAFRIPIEGNLDDPDRGTWAAFTRDTEGRIRF